MALQRDVVIRLLGDADSAIRAQRAAAEAAGVSEAAYRRAEREQQRQARAAEEAARRQRAAMDQVGKGAALMGAAIVAGLGMAAKAAIDWESAWAGVTKVVNGTPAQMNGLEKSLRNLATTLPATHEEIAGVAEAAGQLGIARGDIVKFTKTAIALGVSTNLSAEDAANGLARLSNITGTASKDVDRLGATLVALGNAGASTESEILDMGLRIAAAGHQAHMTDGDILGIANAMSSMGIEAEAGGTSISRVIKQINSDVIGGGKELGKFAKLAGMSSQQFADAWDKNAAKALTSVIAGLGKVQESGGDANAVLSDLGLSNIRVSDTMLRLSANAGLLTGSLATGNKAWADNTALTKEANKRYETTAARLQMARNQINDAAIDIGSTFLPILSKGAGVLADFARGFESLPGPAKTVLGVLGLTAGAVALIGGAAIIAVPKVIAFRATLQTLSTSSGAAVRGMSKLGLFMTGPWGAAIGVGTVLLGGLVTWLGASSRASDEARNATKELADALRDSNGAIDANIRNLAAKEAEDKGLLELADKIGVSQGLVVRGLLHEGSAYDDLRGKIKAYIDAHTFAGGRGQGTYLDQEGKDATALLGKFDDLTKGLGENVQANKRVAEAAKESGDAAAGSKPGIDAATGATAAFGQQADEAAQELQQWLDKLASIGEAFVEPLDVYKGLLSDKQAAEQDAAQATADATKSSKDSWKDYVKDVSVSLDEYAAKLEEQIKNQENWRTNLVTVAGRGGIEVAQILAGMGKDGAQLTAQMATATDANFQRMAADLIKDAHLGGQGAATELDTAMKVMAAIGAAGAKATAKNIADQLGIGVKQVEAIAAQYGVKLASGVNPLLAALGAVQINMGGFRATSHLGSRIMQADGGVVDFYAAGGGMENHRAQIARGGDWRVWAEPETGGEAYIPLAPGKRDRSTHIWRETGRRLGVQFQEFAGGGFTGGIASVPHPPSTRPFGPPLSTAGDAAMQHEYMVVTNWMRQNGFEAGTGLVAALAWAKSQVGKPYIWGGVGPAGYDCSGFQSALVNVARGRSPYSRVGSTATFPWGGFQPGYGAYTIGSTKNAGGGVGHMAGTLLGVNVESAGGVGVRIGSSARGANSGLFDTRAHLTGYETGTPFVPMTDIYKLHLGEAVLNREQAAAYRTGLAAGAGIPVGGSRSSVSAGSSAGRGLGPVTVIAQFGTETLEARTVRVVDDALGAVHDAVHYGAGVSWRRR